MQGAANAILTLSKALYGKRITPEQYTNLLNCKSCNEIASYLRSNTNYASAFEGSLKTEYSAQNLCDIVKKYSFDNFMYLYRFEVATGQKFSKYFIIKNDIEQILKCTLLILSGNKEDYIFSFQSFLDKYLTVDLFSLAKANSLEEIAQVLEKTKYSKVYQECLKEKDVNYLVFETKLNDFFDKYQLQLLDSCLKKAEKKYMLDLISKDLDLAHIQKICRIIKYYGDNVELKNSISNLKITKFSKNQVKALTQTTCISDVRNILSMSAYRKVKDFDEKDIRSDFQKYLFDFYKKRLRFSQYPSEVMFCYLFLAENECSNIIKIIEGCNYHISPDEIRSSLIGI